MAQRRMIHKSISWSEQVNALSNDFARLLFTWTIPHLDDFGKIEGKAPVIKAIVIPMLFDKTVNDVEQAITEQVEKGLIERYEAEGRLVIKYTNFDKYQTGLNRRTKSSFPDNPRDLNKFTEIPRFSSPSEAKITEQNLNANRSEENITNSLSKKEEEFQPSNEGEYAALEAFKKLEPNNQKSLRTTYLAALKKGVPAHVLWRFTSEVRQDPTIKNQGAVFNAKVKDWLEKNKKQTDF